MYFLDTNTCMNFLKGTYKSIEEHFRKTPPQEIKITSIMKAELLFAIERSKEVEKNRKIYENFIKPFETFYFDDAAAVQYAIIRADLEKFGKLIGSNDLLTAAIVMANKGILITHNTTEFKRIPNLVIEDWVG